MIYGLEREGDKLILTVYNSGAGIEFHEKREERRKLRFNPEMRIEIPEVQRSFDLRSFLGTLTQAGMDPYWEGEPCNQKLIYEGLLKNLPGNAKIVPAREGAKFINPQISGTCAWKVMTAVLKNTLPREPNNLRDNMRIFIKTQSLLDYFTQKSATHELGNEQVKQELLDGIAKLNRLVAKLIKDIEREIEQDLKKQIEKQSLLDQYQDVLKLCDYMQKTIARQSKTLSDIPAPSQKELFEFQVKGEFNKEAVHSKFQEGVQSFWKDIIGKKKTIAPEKVTDEDVKLAAAIELPIEFTKNRTAKDFIGRNGCVVLDVELQKIQKMVASNASNKMILKTIEDLFLNIPLDAEYWNKLSPEEARHAVTYLAGLLGQFNESLSNIPQFRNHRLPSQQLAIISLSVIHSYLGARYFGSSPDKSFQANREELRKMIVDILRNPLYVHDDPTLDRRLKEIEQCHEIPVKRTDKEMRESKDPFDFEDFAAQCFKKNPSLLEELLEKAIEEFNKKAADNARILHLDVEKLKINNPSQIMNKELFALGYALGHEPKRLPKEIYEKCMTLAFSKAMEKSTFRALTAYKQEDVDGHPEKPFKLTELKDFGELIKLTPHVHVSDSGKETTYSFTVDTQNTMKDLAVTDHMESSNIVKSGASATAFQKQINFSFIDKTFLREFHFTDFGSSPIANAVQVNNLGGMGVLTPEISEMRALLHTRITDETQIAVTLDRFQSLIQNLSNVDYQNLLISNLLQPYLLQDALENAPEIAENIMELIEQGLKYHAEEDLSITAAFFYKLNQDLRGFLDRHQEDQGVQDSPRIQALQKRISRINKKMNRDIKRNEIRLFEKDPKNSNDYLLKGEARDEAILLQNRLYYCSMHQQAYKIRKVQRNKIVSEDYVGKRISKYLKAKFFTNNYEFETKKRDYQINPLALDKEDTLDFYMQGALEHYLLKTKAKSDKTLLDFIVKCLPPQMADDVKKVQGFAKIKFNFPIVTLEWMDAPQGKKEMMELKEINIVLGPEDFTVVKEGGLSKKLPNWAKEFLERPDTKKLFPISPTECFVLKNKIFFSDFDAIQFEYIEGGKKDGIKRQYRIERYQGATRLMKEVQIGSKSYWMEHNMEQVELRMKGRDIPAFLDDSNFQMWVSIAPTEDTRENVIIFTDTRTGKDSFLLQDGRIFKLKEDGNLGDYQLVKLDRLHEATVASDAAQALDATEAADVRHKTPLDFLADFEAPQFIEVQKRTTTTPSKEPKEEPNVIIRFPRFQEEGNTLEFRSKLVGGENELVWKQDESYAINLQNSLTVIDGFPYALRLKPIEKSQIGKAGSKRAKEQDTLKEKKQLKEIALIPICPFIAPRRGTKNAGSIVLDREGNYLEDLRLEGDGEDSARGQFNTKQWNITGTKRFAKFQIGDNGELIAASSLDYLYLAYLYSSYDKMDEAFKALQKFQEMGGFSGSREEAQILSWLFPTEYEVEIFPHQDPPKMEKRILGGVPYAMKTNPKRSEHPVSENLSTPELWAFRAKILGSLTEYLDAQGKFNIKSSSMQTAFVKEDERILTFLKKENLEKQVAKHLEEYQKIKRNIRPRFKLKILEHQTLFHFLPDASTKNFPVYLKDTQSKLHNAYERLMQMTGLGKKEKEELSLEEMRPGMRTGTEFTTQKVTITIPKVDEPLPLDRISSELLTGQDFYSHKKIDPAKKYGARIVPIAELNNNVNDVDLIFSFNHYLSCINNNKLSGPEFSKLLSVVNSKIKGHLMSKLPDSGFKTANFNLSEMDLETTAATLSLILYSVVNTITPETFEPIQDEKTLGSYLKFVQSELAESPLTVELPVYQDKIVPRNTERPLKPLTLIEEVPKKEQQILRLKPYKQALPHLEELLNQFGFDPEMLNKNKRAAEELDIKERDEDRKEGWKRNEWERKFKNDFQKACEKNPKAIADLKRALEKELGKEPFGEERAEKTAEEIIQARKGKKNAVDILKDREKKLLALANQLPPGLTEKLLAEARELGQEHPVLTLDMLIALFIKSDFKAYLKATHYESKGKTKKEAEKERAMVDNLFQMTGKYLIEATQLKHYQRCLDEFENLAKFDASHKKAPLTAVEKQEREQIVAKLGSVLYQKRSYDLETQPKNAAEQEQAAAFLAFEYYENILIFDKQKEILKVLLDKNRNLETGGFKDEIIQLIMGGGKSKVLMPLSAYQKAQGDNLVAIIVPQALRNTNFRDLKATSMQRFNQEAFPFHFSRTSDCSVKNLSRIRDYLRNVILKKGYLVTTNNDVQSLELKWMEILEQLRPEYKSPLQTRKEELLAELEQLPKTISARRKLTDEWKVYVELRHEIDQIEIKIQKEKEEAVQRAGVALPILEEILDLFNNRADVYVDEVDSIQDVRKELNYTLGEEIPMDKHVIDAISALYRDIQHIPFELHKKIRSEGKFKVQTLKNAKGLTSFQIKDFFHSPDSIPKLSEDEWKDAFMKDIVPNLVEALANNPENPLHDILAGLDAKTAADIKSYIRGEREFPTSTAAKDLKLAAQDVIALYKEQMNTFLPLTLYRTPKVNYGYTQIERKESETLVAIPYIGNNIPSEESRFASPFETANYTAQLNYIYGVSKIALKKMLLEFKKQALNEKNELNIAITETPAAKKFLELTELKNVRLSTLDPENPRVLEEIYAELKQKDPSVMNRVVDYCLPRYILNNVKSSPMILRHNADDHSHLYRSFQGGSGTILSPFVFDERTNFTKKIGLGTDGRVIDYLIQNETKVSLPIEDEKIFDTVFRLLGSKAKNTRNEPNYRAIIDVGSHFKGIQNLEVAKQIARYYQTEYYQNKEESPIEWVLFFNEQNQLCALRVNANPEAKSEIRILGSSNPKFIESQLQCKPAQCFTYYDEQRTTGTDIKQMLNAKAICTFSAGTLKKDLLQAVMRMRDLANTQKIQILLSKDMILGRPDIPREEWDIDKVLAVAEENQQSKVQEDNFRVAMNKLRGLIRRDLMKRIRSAPDLATKALFARAFHQFIATDQSMSPAKLFLGSESEQLTEDLLNTEKKKLIDDWKQCLQTANTPPELSQQEALQTTMQHIIDRVKQQNLCALRTKARKEGSDAQVQTVKLAEVETAQETLTQAKRLNQVKLEVNNTVMDESAKVTAVTEKGFSFRPLNWYLSKISDEQFKPPEGLKFSKNLYMTQNQATVFKEQGDNFFLREKPFDCIAWFYDKKGALSAVLMTQKEAQAYVQNKDKLPENFWITTPKGIPIPGGGHVPDAKDLPSDYYRLREQIYYINGDTDKLALEKNNLTWIKENFEEKINFYENVILGCYPHKSSTFLFLKADLKKQIGPQALAAQQEEYKIAMDVMSPKSADLLMAFQSIIGEKEDKQSKDAKKDKEKPGIKGGPPR